MHFYLVTSNIVPPIVCIDNYQNKNSIIRYLLSPLSTDTQSYTKSLKMKLNNKNALNVIYKIKSYFPQPVQAPGHTTYNFVLLLWKLGCCILKRLERESRFLFSKKYKGGRGERGQFIGENSVCIIVTNTKRSMKKCYWFPRPVLLYLLLVLYYTIIQIFTIVSASVNK